jgi:pullulanase
MNSELVNYYKGLISLRNNYPAFRRAGYEDITFYDSKDNRFAMEYHLKYNGEEFIVLFNANPDSEEEFHLPRGEWQVLVSPEKAGIISQGNVVSEIEVQPSTGYVLKKT